MQRFVCDPQDKLKIVSEGPQVVVLKIEAYDRRKGRTEQFEFEINGRQIQALLTFGSTAR